MAATFLEHVEGLEAGDHACLVYDSEERRDRALLAFVTRGLCLGERVLYLARNAHDPLVSSLSQQQAVPEQLAVLLSEECYLRDGVFDMDGTLTGFREVPGEAAAVGYSTVRVAGGPPAAVTDNGTSQLVAEYERRAAALFDDGSLISVCAYDGRRTPPAALLGIIDAHPIVLYALGRMQQLHVRVTGEATLTPVGWLDLTTLGGLIEPLARAVRSGHDVAVDLGSVGFVDVASLRVLAEAARELRAAGRQLTLLNAPDPVPTMVKLLGYEEEEGLVLS